MTSKIFTEQLGYNYIDINSKFQCVNPVYGCSQSIESHWIEAKGATKLYIPI